MAKYTGPVCRLCRREGNKLFLKGDRCYTSKCAFLKNQNPPGSHGISRGKVSSYGVQLREKQKTKRIYNLTEKQFHKYYLLAAKMRGSTGENMMILLERRLDNVAYRMGIGVSRAQARQLVNHGHITVNGKRVNIPSFLVKPGDEIAIKENKKSLPFFAELRNAKVNSSLKWLQFDPSTLSGKILEMPEREDIDMTIAEHMIVELYSK